MLPEFMDITRSYELDGTVANNAEVAARVREELAALNGELARLNLLSRDKPMLELFHADGATYSLPDIVWTDTPGYLNMGELSEIVPQVVVPEVTGNHVIPVVVLEQGRVASAVSSLENNQTLAADGSGTCVARLAQHDPLFTLLHHSASESLEKSVVVCTMVDRAPGFSMAEGSATMPVALELVCKALNLSTEYLGSSRGIYAVINRTTPSLLAPWHCRTCSASAEKSCVCSDRQKLFAYVCVVWPPGGALS